MNTVTDTASQVKDRSPRVPRPVQADGSGRSRLSVAKGRKVHVDAYEVQTFSAYIVADESRGAFRLHPAC